MEMDRGVSAAPRDRKRNMGSDRAIVSRHDYESEPASRSKVECAFTIPRELRSKNMHEDSRTFGRSINDDDAFRQSFFSAYRFGGFGRPRRSRKVPGR